MRVKPEPSSHTSHYPQSSAIDRWHGALELAYGRRAVEGCGRACNRAGGLCCHCTPRCRWDGSSAQTVVAVPVACRNAGQSPGSIIQARYRIGRQRIDCTTGMASCAHLRRQDGHVCARIGCHSRSSGVSRSLAAGDPAHGRGDCEQSTDCAALSRYRSCHRPHRHRPPRR